MIADRCFETANIYLLFVIIFRRGINCASIILYDKIDYTDAILSEEINYGNFFVYFIYQVYLSLDLLNYFSKIYFNQYLIIFWICDV